MPNAVELICPSNSMKQHPSHTFKFDGDIWRCIRPHCKATASYPSPIELADKYNWLLSYPPGYLNKFQVGNTNYSEIIRMIY